MKQVLRSGWGIVLVAVIATVGSLGLGLVGYWKYAMSVPPFTPHSPSMPKPNGYEQAVTEVNWLLQSQRPPTAARWLKGTRDQVRAQLARVRPILDDVRGSFRLKWRSPTSLGFHDSFQESGFHDCARCFRAESILARDRGDYHAAMQRSLDAIELGSRIPKGGDFVDRSVGISCHAVGFSQVEALVPRLSPSATAAALSRVRRVRGNWPPLAETIEGERLTMFSTLTWIFEEFQRQPLYAQIGALGACEPGLDRWATVRSVLMPRRVAFASLDRSYRERIAESRKPFRHRTSIPTPDLPWLRNLELSWDDTLEYTWEFEWPDTQLALLEVALAVHRYWLQHGRYPAQLRDISRQWLPSVPNDQWDQPIAYLQKGDQALIYSLGPDGKDDRGLAANLRLSGQRTHGDLVFGKLGQSFWSE